MKFATLSALLALTLCAGVEPAHAQCANERAVQRPSSTQESQSGSRCRRVLSIFGLHIGLGGRHCPDTLLITPAHRACEPAPGSNTECDVVGTIEIRVRHCACTELADIDLGVTQQDCRCANAGTAGTVNDHVTIDCFPVPHS
ncbi:MAG: hypothetical protein JNK02_05875 [Planctomycetes bacterium]|nr:hypothetical protein [Planctomycetota bacterium]